MSHEDRPISRQDLLAELHRYRRGSVSRRHFLQVTGLGLAAATLAGEIPALRPRAAWAADDIGDRVVLATWPEYHNPENFKAFTAATGAAVELVEYSATEEMLVKMRAGNTGWDVVVPTNYANPVLANEKLIEPLDQERLPNFVRSAFDPRFSDAGVIDGTVYAVPKNWGTTGFIVNTRFIGDRYPTTWKAFWDLAQTAYSGRTVVHDYQLSVIGNALKALGYSFNSVDPQELAEAEQLLLAVKPHLLAVSSDYQPLLRSGEAWVSMCWSGDGKQLTDDLPEMIYVLGKEGGEVWSDYYAVLTGAPHRSAGYAFINFLLDPAVNAKEVLGHGYPVADSRVIALLPKSILDDPIVYPSADLLSPLVVGAAITLTDPNRQEVMARFRAA